MNSVILSNLASSIASRFPHLQQSAKSIRASLYREGTPRERRTEAANHARVMADQLEEIGECVASANLRQTADMVAR